MNISDKGLVGILLQNSQLLLWEGGSKAGKSKIRACATVLKYGPENKVNGCQKGQKVSEILGVAGVSAS